MKKVFLPWLTVAFAATALVAVSGSAARTDVAGTAAAPASATQGAFRVALVTDIGGLNDRGFNQLANKGLQDARRRLSGVQGRVFISRSPQDYVPNLSTAARQGYNLVIAVGFLMAESTATVANAFPDTKFAIVDVDATTLKDKPTNVRGLLFREQETGYLVGYLAGLVIKRRPVGGQQKIGSVGGIKIPPVDRFIAGYRAGAVAANRQLRRPGALMNAYSQDFVDQAKCKELALQQIANGAGVIFQVAGGCGLGALDAAKQRRVWGIGVDADQAFLGPHVLTSALKRVDVSVSSTIAAARAARANFRGGFNAVFGVRNNGVGLGKISPRVNRADVRAVRAVLARMRAGRIRNIPTRVP